MLGAVGLDVTMRRDKVLQTGLHEETHMGRQVELQAKTEGCGELPRHTDCGLVAGFKHTVHIVVSIEGWTDGNFGRQSETAIEVPQLFTIYSIGAFNGDAEIVDGLLLADGVALCSHLEVGGQTAVAKTRLQSDTSAQPIPQCQRPRYWHAVMAGA